MAGAREGSFANHREPLATCLTTRFCGTLIRGSQKTRTTQTGESTHKTDISRQKGQTKPVAVSDLDVLSITLALALDTRHTSRYTTPDCF